MTEYWVSQGNKWCDYCKIYISNNSASIRTHELGTRHKDNVSKKLAGIRKDNAVKEKEHLLALKDLKKIETQALKSYERDLAATQRLQAAADVESTQKELECRSSGTTTSSPAEQGAANGLPDARDEGSVIGLRTAKKATSEVSQSAQVGIGRQPTTNQNRLLSASPTAARKSQAPLQINRNETKHSKNVAQKESSAATRSVRVGKGVASSLEVGKRKRVEKNGLTSSEETAALVAREAARKRIQEREKSLLGLYHGY